MSTPQKTASQQALIQFIESIVITAIIAGIVSVSSAITGSGPINWHEVWLNFGLAVAFSLAHSLTAYLKALPSNTQTGQPDLIGLGAAIEALTNIVQQRVQPTQGQPVQVAQITQAKPATIAAQPVRPDASLPAQPSTTGIQQSIPAFASTAEMAAVAPAPTGPISTPASQQKV